MNHPFAKTRKEKVGRKDSLGQLIDFPLSYTLSSRLSINPFFSIQWTADDPSPLRASQGSLCPSPALLGRRFLLRLRGTRYILLQSAQEKEKRTVTRYE